jgi:Protein of unknown function (DUF992)
MRWWLTVVVPMCLGFGAAPSSTALIEIGVLTCTLGHAIDTVASAQTPAASEAREMVCSFKAAKDGPEETYAGIVKAIGVVGALPEKVALLWSVRAPMGTAVTPGLLQQSYAADTGTPVGQVPPLIGERNGNISLLTMTEKQEGSGSKDKPTPPEFVVAAVELVLKVSTG